MKLILTQEVGGLGAPGDIVEVKDGYGRNFLIPRGFAIRWTKGGEKQVAQIKRARAAREVADLDAAKALTSNLEGLKVRLAARTGANGRLFGSVTVSDVVDAITAAGGPAVDKRKVTIVSPIKTVGSHKVEVRVHPEAVASFDVEVVSA